MKQYYLSQKADNGYLKFGVIKDFEKNNGKLLLEITDEQINTLYKAMQERKLKTNEYNGKVSNQIYAEVWRNKEEKEVPQMAIRQHAKPDSMNDGFDFTDNNQFKNDDIPF